MCRIPASGSSWKSFAREGVAMDDPGCRQRVLKAKSPDGARYVVLQLDDGTFVHFATVESTNGAHPITSLEAFRAFQSGIKKRCLELPQSGDATIVGNYRMVGE
jgi:hypothetical protein